jgi:hypothetical protein
MCCIDVNFAFIYFMYLFIYLFWWEWGLNSGLHGCKAGVLPLESHLQSVFVLGILEMGFQELFAWAGLQL